MSRKNRQQLVSANGNVEKIGANSNGVVSGSRREPPGLAVSNKSTGVSGNALSGMLLVCVVALFLPACSVFKDDVKQEPAVESKQETPAVAEVEQSVVEQSAVKKHEPVVTVIPSKPDAELQIKDIPKESKSSQVKEDTTQPKAAVQKAEKKTTKKPEKAATEQTAKVAAKPQVAPAAGEQPLKLPTDPNHFLITVEDKDERHPFFKKGHPKGFLLNGIPGADAVMERGKTYKIDVATDPKHDVYFSTKDIGWGSSPLTTGIEGQFIYKGTIVVKPDDKTPGFIFYSCRNHPYMGGKIHVVNAGEAGKVNLAVSRDVSKAKVSQSADTEVSKSKANQKIMFAAMLENSASAKRVMASDNQEAIGLHKNAKSTLAKARESLKSGDNAKALEAAENALAMFKQSSKLVPNEEEKQELRAKHEEILASLKDFEASHQKNYERILKKQGKDAVVDFDREKVKSLKDSAAQSAKKGDYLKANQSLEQAQRLVTVALHKMMNSQTIVYDLNFETAEEEYQYELRRFIGYEELIPVAIEVKKPKEGAVKLMKTFLVKGQELRDMAKDTAKKGDHKTAVLMLQDATNSVRRALRMVGVMQ